MEDTITAISSTDTPAEVAAALLPRPKLGAAPAAPAEPEKPEPEKKPEPTKAAAADDDETLEDDDIEGIEAASAAGRALAQRKAKIQARFHAVTGRRKEETERANKAEQERDAERKRVADERQARERAERELADLKAKAAPAPTEPEKKTAAAEETFTPSKPEPQEDAFDDYQAWDKAHRAWTLDTAAEKSTFEMRAEQRKQEREATEAREKEAREREIAEVRTAYEGRRAAARERLTDWDQVLGPDSPIFNEHLTPEMQSVIATEAHGPELLYHLAKNIDVFNAIKAMTPSRQLFELAKLHAKAEAGTLVSAPAAAEVPAQSTTTVAPTTPVAQATGAATVPVSKAPEPPPRVTGAGGVAETFDPNAESTDFRDWKAWREKSRQDRGLPRR